MKKTIISFVTVVAFLSTACSKKETVIEVSNPMDMDRIVETVSVDLPTGETDQYKIVDVQTKREVLSQLIDDNGDKHFDRIIFQVQLKANETKAFNLVQGESQLQEVETVTYGRFVPERTDDFTWENDKVAFRTYGPEAQRMVEENIPGGTLSSGIDCWLKKVDYSIIDKWYKGYLEDPMYYHSDRGEGLDNYHVGPSRGCGGTGVMKDSAYYTSKNFTGYRTFYNGPISTSFELDYPVYSAGDSKVKERKVISIDLGSSLTKFVVFVDGADTLTAGLTLHDGVGDLKMNKENGWVSYHAAHFGEQLSTAVVADPKYYVGLDKVMSDEPDANHGLVSLKVIDGKVEFYSGFYWTGSNVFDSEEGWKDYLNTVSACLKSPLKVSIK